MSREGPLKHGYGKGGMKLPLCPRCRHKRLDLVTLEPFDDGVMAKGRIRCRKCYHEWEGTFENPQVLLDEVNESVRIGEEALAALDGELGDRLREASRKLAEATDEMNESIRRAEQELIGRFPKSVASVDVEEAKGRQHVLVYDAGLFLVTVHGKNVNKSRLTDASRRLRVLALDFLIPLFEKLAS